MAKVSRYALVRGAKMLSEWVYGLLSSMQTYVGYQTGGRGLGEDQMQSNYAPFRLNLSVPHFGFFSHPTGAPNSGGTPMTCVPFMLPPLQDDLDYTVNPNIGNVPKANEEAPVVILDEFSISFDTRGEPAGITSNWAEGQAAAGSSANQGKLCYELLSKYNLTLSILEKKPTWGQTAPTNYEPSSVVWTGEINADIELSAPYLRSGNPFVVTGINKPIDPYKTYLLVISAPNMAVGFTGAAGPLFELVSIEVSMRFLSPLRKRDSGASIQNIPRRHMGIRNNLNPSATSTGAGLHSSTARPLIGAPLPGAGSDIEANTTKGVQTFMAVIDEFFRSKLKGGYDFNSEVPNRESLDDTAAYSVIAVPLFNNTRFGGASLPDPIGAPVGFPYVTGTSSRFIDRRYIPIEAPMTIHHVLFTYSWDPFLVPNGSGATRTCDEIPKGSLANQRLKLDIGVGMGTGARSDSYGYEQIARRSLDFLSPDPSTGVPNWFSSPVDMIRYGKSSMFPKVNSQLSTHNVELHSMDLEGSGRPGLNGLTAQGYPIFVGRSLAAVSPRLQDQRTPMQVSGAMSQTIGAEQFLEVRAQLYDHNGDWGANWTADQLLMGGGGIWVYIIGKTHLV